MSSLDVSTTNHSAQTSGEEEFSKLTLETPRSAPETMVAEKKRPVAITKLSLVTIKRVSNSRLVKTKAKGAGVLKAIPELDALEVGEKEKVMAAGVKPRPGRGRVVVRPSQKRCRRRGRSR